MSVAAFSEAGARAFAREILIVPGYRGSGANHWQSHLERRLDAARRVEMPGWNEPRRDAWVAALDRAVARCRRAPVIVAHSLGCIAVAHWAASARRPAAAALLVAPCDVDRSALADCLRDFAPLPRARLDFPSVIAASSDDPHLELGRAREFARAWGARLEILGARGHVNVEAGFGPWLEGEALLHGLLGELRL